MTDILNCFEPELLTHTSHRTFVCYYLSRDTVFGHFIASKHTLYTDKRNFIKFINNNSSLANV